MESIVSVDVLVVGGGMAGWMAADHARKEGATVRYPQECTMCMICVADCPADAIEGTKGKYWMTSGY